jgi:hypothetical protein
MSAVPLDLQRRLDQRWAARFQRPIEPAAATRGHRVEKQGQKLAAPSDGKGKSHQLDDLAGQRPAPAA